MDFLCNECDTSVVTTKGRVKGYKFGSVYTFKGIPYARAKRFRMPEETEYWEGTLDTLTYGYTCPLLWDEPLQTDITIPHRFWPQGEDCLNLNLWTKSLDNTAHKPVIVWFHGGGFFAGSSVELLAYEGHDLAEAEDVVVVTVNHRLNILGYMDLRAFGSERARSVNAGNMDLVYALKWIHDNIAAFGGDPNNVTIFGQSGGGGKVISLLQMPAAEGLFHKAMIMSGVLTGPLGADSVDTEPVILKTLELLGLTRDELDTLDTIEYSRLADAYMRAYKDVTGSPWFPHFAPMKNEDYLGNPLKNGFCEFAKHIPIIIGSTFSEFYTQPSEIDGTSDKECLAYLKKRFGKETGMNAYTVFKNTYPNLPANQIMHVDTNGFRSANKEWIAARTKEKCAPTYAYLFNVRFNLDGGAMAWHCADIPFFFHTIDHVPIANLGSESKKLEAAISGAFANFARTGRPFHNDLPTWPPCKSGEELTMILDLQPEVRRNFDDEMIKVLSPLHLSPGLFD